MKFLLSTCLLFTVLLPARTQSLTRDSIRKQPSHSVFLLGDAGAPVTEGDDPNLSALRNQMQKAGKNSTIIYLGDNIYQRGLPDPDDLGRKAAEEKIIAQMKILQNYPGRAIFIPGNHDWDRMGRNGWRYVQNQAQFISQYLQQENVFLPQGGCPGPVEVSLNNKLTLVLIDTQWPLHAWDRPGAENDCEAKDLTDMLVLLDDIIERNINKRVIVAGHHPMYTHGPHGGYYTWKNHLFPFLEIQPKLYIPLPGLGSIYPLYRKIIGSRQDIVHPLNRQMRDGITAVLRQHPNAVYVNGHEHALEHIVQDSIHYITSGSGCKITPVRPRRHGRFAADKVGFGRIDYYPSGEAWLTFWEPDKDHPEGKQLYEVRMLESFREQMAPPDPGDRFDYKDSTVSMAANHIYQAKAFKKFLLGENYRNVWTTPVAAPVFRLNKEAGGLTIGQRGGGMQTKSLRLQAKDGRQYVLRSVEKYAENAIPENLRGSFAADIVQDQISASHPYAALVVPPLAKAAGIFHTNPKLVFVPDDPRLGRNRKAFANTLCLLEERPDEGFEKTDLFGGAEKISSTTKLIDKLYDDNDNRVDQQAVLRARLFDMIIGDWDRHDDQWRWASFKTKNGTIYKPIPRDRDQAFFVNQGLLPKIASRKWIMPKIQGFDYQIRDVPGLNFNARYFDRSFLTEPDLAAWKAMADTLKRLLTDEVIENAIHQWPEPIFKLSGETVIAKLKKRRDDLSRYAEAQYRFLSRAVDVVGSNKEEQFDVHRLEDGKTKVTVRKVGKDSDLEQVMYERTFVPSQTREVRMYGLNGDDRFVLHGRAQKGITIRVIGGKGRDTIIDSSKVAGLQRKNLVYDTKKGNEIKPGSETRDMTGSYAGVNDYNRKSFRYNLVAPLLSLQYNPDDGLFVGGGFLVKKQGFRNEPYAAQHRLTANYAFATRAYNFRYAGDFTDVIGRLDLQVNGEVRAPNFVNNFFGLGNETVYNKENRINYYRTRFENWGLNALLRYAPNTNTTFFFGPAFESVEVERTPGRFIENFSENGSGEPKNVFERKPYGGLKLGFNIDSRDNQMMPSSGVHWYTESTLYHGLNPLAQNLTRIQSDLAFYWSIRLPARLTLATRFGGGINFTDYEFFQANALGGLTNLRGYRRTRFSGKSSFYNNTEVRLRLFSFKTYLFPAYAGIVGFHDVGRVWLKGEASSKWHQGYGGGIWIAPFKIVVVSAMYTVSEEDRLPLVKLGFFF